MACGSTTTGSSVDIGVTTSQISIDEKKNNRFKIMKFLIEESGIQGMTKERAAGICGNMFAESGFNPTAVNPSSKAIGLCQWLGARKKRLQALADSKSTTITDIDLQLAFLVQEINGTHKGAWKKVVNAPNTVDDATKKFLRWYEVPGVDSASADARTEEVAPKRIGYAKKAFLSYPNNKDESF